MFVSHADPEHNHASVACLASGRGQSANASALLENLVCLVIEWLRIQAESLAALFLVADFTENQRDLGQSIRLEKCLQKPHSHQSQNGRQEERPLRD